MDGSCYEFNVSSRVAKNNFCLPLLIQINSKRRSEESFQNGENDRRTWCGRLSVRMLTMPLARNRLPTSSTCAAWNVVERPRGLLMRHQQVVEKEA